MVLDSFFSFLNALYFYTFYLPLSDKTCSHDPEKSDSFTFLYAVQQIQWYTRAVMYYTQTRKKKTQQNALHCLDYRTYSVFLCGLWLAEVQFFDPLTHKSI